MKKRLRYIWKYWIRPIVFMIDPNSPEGLRIRADKLSEDDKEVRE